MLRLGMVCALLVAGCDRPERSTFQDRLALAAEIERVKPFVLTCDGMVALATTNNITGQENCGTGDGMTNHGFAMLYGRIGSMDAVANSISADGRPWRSPQYKDRDTFDSFSRDQFLGLLEATVASGDKTYLKRVLDYEKRTGSLCPDDTDTKCRLTNSLRALSAAVMVGSKEASLLDVATVLVEAKTATGYQAFLTGRKIMLSKILGRSGHEKAANELHRRFPNNGYFAYIAGDNKAAGSLVLDCLRGINNPGDQVTYHHPACVANAAVFDIMSVGRAVLRGR
jgi:hypothetical protein